MKVLLHYEDNADTSLHKSLKITLPKSWKNGPTSRLLRQFVETYNASETLGSQNPLDESTLHLALRPDDNASSPFTPLPSDAIVIEVIPDRGANISVLHGPSQTRQEITAAQRMEVERKRAEQANKVACTHFGCKNRFPRGGPYPECSYHASPPVFHETAKFWSCCPNKKAYDWEDFQMIPGCLTGVCSEVKEQDGEKQFLGGCDLREAVGEANKLKSIDDFNKAQAAGGSDAAPILERLRGILGEVGVENELFDQVVDGFQKEKGGDASLDIVVEEMGKKLKSAMKAIVVEQLRIK